MGCSPDRLYTIYSIYIVAACEPSERSLCNKRRSSDGAVQVGEFGNTRGRARPYAPCRFSMQYSLTCVVLEIYIKYWALYILVDILFVSQCTSAHALIDIKKVFLKIQQAIVSIKFDAQEYDFTVSGFEIRDIINCITGFHEFQQL